MSDDIFKLNHNKFTLRRLGGIVRSADSWSESQVEGGGGSMKVVAGFGHGHQNKVHTTTTNYTEFWLEAEDATEHYYKVDTSLPLREGQEIEVIELVYSKGKKAGQAKLVMLNNFTQGRYYTLMKPGNLLMLEHPWLLFLFLFMLFGFFGWMSPAIGLPHIATLLIGIPWLIKKRRYYKKKLRALDSLFAA